MDDERGDPGVRGTLSRVRTGLTPEMVVRRHGGTATWTQLAEHVTQHALRSALQAGLVLRAARGVYALPELPTAREVAARCGGVVSHLSAAEQHRLPLLLPPETASVTVPPNAHPPPRSDVVYRWRSLAPADVERRAAVTTPLRTVLDCAADLDRLEALAVADGALRLGLVHQEDLLAAAVRRRRGRRAACWVAEHADGRAANPFESALRGLALSAGCTGFEPQVRIDAGRPVRVDLADRRRRVVLEADSFEWHGDRRALRRDARRYDELVRAGWTVLRFAWEDVMLDQEWVIGVLRDVAG